MSFFGKLVFHSIVKKITNDGRMIEIWLSNVSVYYILQYIPYFMYDECALRMCIA